MPLPFKFPTQTGLTSLKPFTLSVQPQTPTSAQLPRRTAAVLKAPPPSKLAVSFIEPCHLRRRRRRRAVALCSPPIDPAITLTAEPVLDRRAAATTMASLLAPLSIYVL
ncbi:hypothetical protein M0R45_034845 [Rubus argutus]|uniref:Uncharacterized protein n=1 Tax=Rubus argutus TaxID=59490 RepID=A0AAW1VV03_RUBAR